MPAEPTLHIHGHGAVSSAGFDPASLYKACLEKTEIPVSTLERTLGEKTISYPTRPIDTKALRGHMPKHPRLRRSSNVTKFAVTAAHQAIGSERLEKIKNRELNIGIVLSFMNGCVNYSNRFFGEVLSDPAFASPILFPETVFNAPASHIASFLDCDGPVYTLIGDTATWFSAFDVANDWITSGLVDGCLILTAEEIDWLTLEALSLYSKDLIATEGAAAVYVEKTPSEIALQTLSGSFTYTDSQERLTAITQAFGSIKNKNGILVDGLTGSSRLDKDEAAITASCAACRLSPAKTLGEGMGIRYGLQTIAAIESLKDHHTASILAAGTNQQSFSAHLTRNP
ncbi:MAG: beta-ketoacyl synthase N-terminal-like domain-containing protein [Luteolibacter sp.]